MSTAAKIATCSYCGTRVLISLSGRERHELVCNSCGAPLQNTKLIHQNNPQFAAAQPLFKTPETTPREDKKEIKHKEKRRRERRESEEYKKDRKYKSRDSEDRKWSKEDDDLKKKYRERKYHKGKKPTKKRRGLFYWIREAADEIDDIFD